MKIKINDEMLDEVMSKTLYQSIGYMFTELVELENEYNEVGELEDYKRRDFVDTVENMAAAKIMYKYYTPWTRQKDLSQYEFEVGAMLIVGGVTMLFDETLTI